MGTLLHADDIVLLAESESDLQSLLNIVYSWCRKRRLKINKDKNSDDVFSPEDNATIKFKFNFGSIHLSYTHHYKH